MTQTGATPSTALAGSPRILVAEDNAMNQKLILRQLALLGFDADIAGDGIQALGCWRNGGHALLLCDLRMPRMDGFELAAAIRAAEQAGQAPASRIPIIALTASAPGDEAERCNSAGMDGCLGKPVQLGELKAVLQHWLPCTAGSPGVAGVEAWPACHAVVDVRVLVALIGPDPATNRRLQKQFQASAAEIATKLGPYCLQGKTRLAGEQAHKLGSAARAVGAIALGRLCAEMELAGKRDEAHALERLWLPFERELHAVNLFLDALPHPQAGRGASELADDRVGVSS